MHVFPTPGRPWRRNIKPLPFPFTKSAAHASRPIGSSFLSIRAKLFANALRVLTRVSSITRTSIMWRSNCGSTQLATWTFSEDNRSISTLRRVWEEFRLTPSSGRENKRLNRTRQKEILVRFKFSTRLKCYPIVVAKQGSQLPLVRIIGFFTHRACAVWYPLSHIIVNHQYRLLVGTVEALHIDHD